MLHYNQGRYIKLAHRLCFDVHYFFIFCIWEIKFWQSPLKYQIWEFSQCGSFPYPLRCFQSLESNGPFKAQRTQVIESQVILCLHYIVICTTGGGSSVRWRNFRCSAKTVHFSCKIYIFRGDKSSKNLVCGAKNDKYEVQIRYQVFNLSFQAFL